MKHSTAWTRCFDNGCNGCELCIDPDEQGNIMNIPPEGAQSADPVREAAQALLGEIGQFLGTLPDEICEGADALRTALAAPEGPGPTDEVARKDGSMSFEEAQDLARKHAKAEPESYYSEPFEPHLWVINAVVEASAHWYQRAVDERVRRVKESNSRALEAPPPVEARQPHNPWRASIENILTGDNYFRAAEWHELLADLDRLYAMPPAVKPLDDPRLQQAFGDAIEGALAFGYQQNNKPPVGHWLNRFWNIGSAEAEKASKPPIVTDEMVTAYLKANDEYWRKVDEIAPPIGVWRNGTPREATRESLRAALAAPAGAIQPHLDHQVESSSGTAAALGRITLLKGSVVKMGGLPHELLADVESYCASRAAAPQGGDTGAPS